MKKLIVFFSICLSVIINVDAAVLSVWDDVNRTAHFDYEENDVSAELDDAAGNPNNHNGTLTGDNFTYVTSPGSGFAGNYTPGDYHTLANPTDLNTFTEMEINFLYTPYDVSANILLLIGYDSANYKLDQYSGRIRMYFRLADTDCNIDWYEYAAFLVAGKTYFITASYNGTHCQLLSNVSTVLRVEAAGGAYAIDPLDPIVIGGRSGGGSANALIDCVSFHKNNTLSISARQDAYDDCFEAAAPPADPCEPPASGNFDVDCGNQCNWTVADTIPGNITMTGPGITTLSTDWTFTSSNQYIFVDLGCEFRVSTGGNFK